jgi:hypothetical protein
MSVSGYTQSWCEFMSPAYSNINYVLFVSYSRVNFPKLSENTYSN